MPIHSAVMVTAANATPKHARMMWNPSDDPICDRAGTGLVALTARTCVIVPSTRPPYAGPRGPHRGCGQSRYVYRYCTPGTRVSTGNVLAEMAPGT